MTDVNNAKRLRELAVAAFKYDSPFTISQFQAAANPQAIIELLDHIDRLEACIKQEIKRCGVWKEGREALEGGK